jgi:hypothetical protein
MSAFADRARFEARAGARRRGLRRRYQSAKADFVCSLQRLQSPGHPSPAEQGRDGRLPYIRYLSPRKTIVPISGMLIISKCFCPNPQPRSSSVGSAYSASVAA